MVSSNDVTITDGDAGFLRAEGDGVYNIYSPAEVAALRARFVAEIDDPNHAYVIGYRKALDDVAERMPEDVQKLVDEARVQADALRTPPMREAEVLHGSELIEALADAHEAAYSQKVEPEPEWEYGYTSKWGSQACVSLGQARHMGAALRGRIAAGTEGGDLEYHGKPVRRRRAQGPGEWEPVEDEVASNGE